MLNQTTVEKLKELRLSTFAEELQQQFENPAFHDLSFEERLGMLVDAELDNRQSNRIERLIKGAKFDEPNACPENIEYDVDRNLDKTLITKLSTCNFINEKRNVILMGSSGAGKSFISTALGVAACRRSYKVKYLRLPSLLEDLAVARGEGEVKKLLKEYGKVDLIVLDDWLLQPLSELQARDLLEIIHSKYNRGSIIFCSQFAPGGWHEKLGNDTTADAILDRVIHNSYEIFIDGKDSMRKKKGIK